MRMTGEQLAKWGSRYGMTLNEVIELQRLNKARGRAAEKSCNGDYHKDAVNPRDKNECMKLWDQECDEIDKHIVAFATLVGFTRVYFPGIYPAFEMGVDKSIMVPE